MLRRSDINHILRAAASLTGHRRFVMVGTGAVIATARHIPVAMMLTAEIDIYAEEATDPGLVSDLIDGSIGRDSQFHRTFGYYGDGVSPRTAIMPPDWRSRAVEYVTPEAWEDIRVKSAERIRAALLGPKAVNVIAPEGGREQGSFHNCGKCGAGHRLARRPSPWRQCPFGNCAGYSWALSPREDSGALLRDEPIPVSCRVMDL